MNTHGLKRDFHLLKEVGEVPKFDMRGAGWKPFAEVYGEELHRSIVTALRERPEAREILVTHVRQAWWHVRMCRGSAAKDAVPWGHVATVLETMELFEDAGLPLFDLQRLTDCLSAACSCDECDLAGGQRLVALGPLP